MRMLCQALPAFALLAAATGAAALPHAQGSCGGGSYRVVRGDTLYSIARLCRSSVAGLVRMNGLRSPILPGQRLRLREEAPKAAGAEDDGTTIGNGHRVEAGDTLYSLARRMRVSLAALLAANPGIDPERMEIGDIVRLPQGAAAPEPARPRQRAQPAAPDEDEAAKPEDEDEREPEGM
jgi:LysM repeat protein